MLSVIAFNCVVFLFAKKLKIFKIFSNSEKAKLHNISSWLKYLQQ